MFTTNNDAGKRRPLTTDLMAPSFTGVSLSLVDLHRACLRLGVAAIENRTFLDCRIEGPAVMLALDGLTFDNTDFGYAKGDIRNLVLFPASPNGVIGAIPMRNCVFKDSEFFGVGFTGSEQFTDQVLALGTTR